jgi:hypothetical protein
MKGLRKFAKSLTQDSRFSYSEIWTRNLPIIELDYHLFDRVVELYDSQDLETEKYGNEPTGPGTKNECAVEGQKQSTRPTYSTER